MPTHQHGNTEREAEDRDTREPNKQECKQGIEETQNRLTSNY